MNSIFIRCFNLVLLFVLAFAAALGQPMNVLFMVADDLRPLLGAYSDPIAVTPNIDSIAAKGVVFTRAYCQQALCAPSRTSFLTSRRPDTTRLYDFYSYWREAAGNFTTLPQYLKENGYHTVSVGKIFHPDVTSNFTDDYPYSWSEVPYRPSTEAFMRAKVCRGSDGHLHENIVCPVDVDTQPEKTLPDLQSAQFAVSFLQRWKSTESGPFFLAVGFHKPHIPLRYPEKYLNLYPLDAIPLAPDRSMTKHLPPVAWNPWTDLREREDVQALQPHFPYGPLPDQFQRLVKQSYYAAVSFMDDQVGQVLEALSQANYSHNTIVVFIGDHGWSMGEHQEWSKYSNFEMSVRVPFIVSVPGLTDHSGKRYNPVSIISKIESNLDYFSQYETPNVTTSDALVELVDIFPTLVQLVGLGSVRLCPKNSSDVIVCTEGLSLVPAIENAVGVKSKQHKRNWRKKAVFSQYPRPSLQPQNNSDKPRLKQIQIMGYTVRTADFRYTEWVQFDRANFSGNWSQVYARELYVHKPGEGSSEDVNVVEEPVYAGVVKRLSKWLRKGWRNALPKIRQFKARSKKVSSKSTSLVCQNRNPLQYH